MLNLLIECTPEDRHEEADKGRVGSCDVLHHYHQTNQGWLGIGEAKCLKMIAFCCILVFPPFLHVSSELSLNSQFKPCFTSSACYSSFSFLPFLSIPLSLISFLMLLILLFPTASSLFNCVLPTSKFTLCHQRGSDLIERTRFAEVAKEGKQRKDLNLRA